MQNEHTISQATSYWASHLGCSTETLFAQPLHVVTHRAGLADYDGIFALFRGGATTVSFPPDCVSVITRPAFRGRGFGASAVAHVAAVALAAGLVPQYRTLQSNRASIRIAESLGFFRYAKSVAVRLNGAALRCS